MNKFIISCFILLCGCGLKCDPNQLNSSMTREDLIKLCGKPNHINYSFYSEQWVYGLSEYIYIKNNRFSSAQWSR